MQSIRAVLFDMDGLALDTESISYEAYLRAGKKFGFQVNERLHMDLGGRTEECVIAELKQVFGADKNVIEWRKYINKQKDLIASERGYIGKRPGLLELLNYLNERHIPYALASSTNKQKILENLSKEYLIHAFPVIVSGDMVHHSKPDPEIFQISAKRLHVLPKNALVLEDARAGIIAARRGGFQNAFIFDDVSKLGSLDQGFPFLVDLPDPRDVEKLAQYKPANLAEVISIIESTDVKETYA